MTRFFRALPFVLLAIAFAAMPPAAAAQANPTGISGQSTEDKTVRGELLKVDMDNLTLTIKNADGDEVEFVYTSDLKVEGIENGVEGLSTKTGTKLIVHYKMQTDEEQNQKMVATKIEIAKNDSRI